MTRDEYQCVNRRARLGDLCALSVMLWPRMYDHALDIYDARFGDALASADPPSLWLSHGRWRFAGQVPRVAFPRRKLP
jgi:hypothetical protein